MGVAADGQWFRFVPRGAGVSMGRGRVTALVLMALMVIASSDETADCSTRASRFCKEWHGGECESAKVQELAQTLCAPDLGARPSLPQSSEEEQLLAEVQDIVIKSVRGIAEDVKEVKKNVASDAEQENEAAKLMEKDRADNLRLGKCLAKLEHYKKASTPGLSDVKRLLAPQVNFAPAAHLWSFTLHRDDLTLLFSCRVLRGEAMPVHQRDAGSVPPNPQVCLRPRSRVARQAYPSGKSMRSTVWTRYPKLCMTTLVKTLATMLQRRRWRGNLTRHSHVVPRNTQVSCRP
jgi:hypothetical protein